MPRTMRPGHVIVSSSPIACPRSEFHTTICVLEGLLEYEKTKGSAAVVTDARLRGQEYFLERGLFKSLSSGGVIDPDWTQFSFPTRWHYDVCQRYS